MKISILTPNLSHNCLGRAYLLAKILQRHYEVEIVGPMFGEGIWEPLANDKSIVYKFIKAHGKLKFWQINELTKKIDGDVIYTSKLLRKSFGVGLIKKFFSRKPLILDIDDWEFGFVKKGYNSLSPHHCFRFSIPYIFYYYKHKIVPYWKNLILEKMIRFANEITVSNHFLKEKYGGIIVYHGRDTVVFDPNKLNGELIKEKFNIEKTKKIVMFFGTPRISKGVDDLVKSISLIKNWKILLVVVGINDEQYCQKLAKIWKKILGNRFKAFGLQPFEKVPEFLSMADVVVIPQRKNSATIGQIPAKVFDAMAMAKPIISTNVSDLPEILDGCGWIVEPEKPEELAKIIQYILDNPEEAEEMGQKARQKCIEKYSWDAMEKVLVKIFKKYE